MAVAGVLKRRKARTLKARGVQAGEEAEGEG